MVFQPSFFGAIEIEAVSKILCILQKTHKIFGFFSDSMREFVEN
jgi:hypothetical protein